MAEGTTTYTCVINGVSELIHHCGTQGLADSPIKDEIKAITSVTASKRGDEQNKELKRLESLNSLWLNGLRVWVPTSALRATIENAARKSKDGTRVREGLLVVSSVFDWDRERYGTDGSDAALRGLAENVAFQTPVVVQRARILRTRAMFGMPWSVTFDVEADNDLVGEKDLSRWLAIAGSRVGLGDWRPQKSGIYGRFQLASIEATA